MAQVMTLANLAAAALPVLPTGFLTLREWTGTLPTRVALGRWRYAARSILGRPPRDMRLRLMPGPVPKIASVQSIPLGYLDPDHIRTPSGRSPIDDPVRRAAFRKRIEAFDPLWWDSLYARGASNDRTRHTRDIFDDTGRKIGTWVRFSAFACYCGVFYDDDRWVVGGVRWLWDVRAPAIRGRFCRCPWLSYLR